MSELLDREKILSAMSESSRASVTALTVAEETTSTQADALAAPTPREGCAVFLAERQTAGQGRRGRSWASPPSANLYMSISRRFRNDLATMSGLSLAVGVTLAETLNDLSSRRSGFSRDSSSPSPIRVKWPNDLIANGQKLGGILIQLRSDAEAGTAAVIGIGINVHMPEDAAAQIDQPWCDLHTLGFDELSRNTLATNLLDQLVPSFELFEREGLLPFLPRWQQLDALAGQNVRVLDGALIHEGISLGITDSGALRIRLGDQERAFHSGEVSLRSA